MSARRRAHLAAPRDGIDPTARRPHVVTIAGVAAAALYAGLASGAAPFTVPADVAVSVASAIFVAALVGERLAPQTRLWRRMERAGPAGGSALPWLAVIALLVAVELASYFHGGPRADYPTISSGLDSLFRYRAAKAAGWLGWLAAGWYLVRR